MFKGKICTCVYSSWLLNVLSSFLCYRLLVRSSDYYLHGVVSRSTLCNRKGTGESVDEVMKEVAREMGMVGFKRVQLPNLEKDLLQMDEVSSYY